MAQIKLKATAKHPTRKDGEIYEAEPAEAARDLWSENGYATRAESAEPTKRSYKRRDMKAEP